MVCTKCARLPKTTLATPNVKRKNELYYGSTGSASSNSKKPSPTLGQNGIGKSKLLSKAAQNPYAAYSSSCETCRVKTDQGKRYCHRCAYKAQVCAMCGKKERKEGLGAGTGRAVVEGQKFSAK